MKDFERGSIESFDEDAKQLRSMGYKQVMARSNVILLAFYYSNSIMLQEFKREFNAVSIFCFSFSIMGVLASVSSTINFPMLSGGPGKQNKKNYGLLHHLSV